MASYTYEQLKEMTVADLRQIAHDLHHESLEGSSTMHKEHLLPLLCKVLGISTHHVAAGEAKPRIKATIRKLRARREALGSGGDAAQLAAIRQQIHALKRRLRQMAEQS